MPWSVRPVTDDLGGRIAIQDPDETRVTEEATRRASQSTCLTHMLFHTLILHSDGQGRVASMCERTSASRCRLEDAVR